MASSSYMPANDVQFREWLTQFMDYLSTNLVHFGLAQADATPLEVATPVFNDALTAYQAARAAASSTSANKNDKRVAMEALLRPMVARLQAYPGTTNEDREQLGIPVRGQSISGSGIEFSDNRPSAVIDIRQRLRHTLRIQNETATGTGKAKPAGALGAEVWVKVGDPPVSESEMEYRGLATRSPFNVDHTEENGNKPAHYQMRWVGSNGEKGAWSEVETATIAA